MTTTATKERPLLFSAPMVRALLAGTKTQTRRIVDVDHAATIGLKLDAGGWLRTYIGDATGETDDPDDQWMMVQDGFDRGMRCKYGRPGDLLWVRETVAIERWTRDYGDHPPLPTDRPWKHVEHPDGDAWFWPHYRATDPAPDLSCERDRCRVCESGEPGPHWTPSIHMPRWASRITLEISEVRVERLQDIREEDARAEGVAEFVRTLPDQPRYALQSNPGAAFTFLWDSVNGAGSWRANPWVWAISFRRVKP